MGFAVERFDHIVLNCRDVDATAAWYERVLGMTSETFGPSHRTALCFGNQKINLRPVAASKQDWFTADHEAAGSDDLCFLTGATPQQVAEHLRACGVAIIEGPTDKRGARGTIVSVYCRDPDGSLIEISSYK